MKPIWSITGGVLALILSYSLAWAQDPAIVFVDEAKAGAKSIMVMDADGSNRTEIFRTGKRFCDCGGPTLSPAISPDGQWLAFVYAGEESTSGFDLLKISSTGGTPEVLLCGSGDTGYYVLPESPQWSPDGSRIAVHLRNFPGGTGPVGSVAVLSATDTAAGCPFYPSQVEVVYPDPDGPFDPYLHIFRGIAWSPDGLRIALLEDSDSDTSTPYQLTIVDLETNSNSQYEFTLPDGYVDDSMWVRLDGLDWQRSGNMVFAFESWGSWNDSNTNSFEDTWLLQVTAGVATVTQLSAGQSPTWAPDDSQLLIGASWWDDSTDGMIRISFSDPPQVQTLGTGYDPDWRRAMPECSASDPCTGDLVCCGGTCVAPSCTDLECDDGDICTDDFCDACSGCSHVFDPSNDVTCEPAGVDCTDFGDKKSCNAELTCRWDNRSGSCIPN